MFKAANDDVFGLRSNHKVLECREPKPGLFTKILRSCDYKPTPAFHVQVRTAHGQKVPTVMRGFSLLLSKVQGPDEHDRLLARECGAGRGPRAHPDHGRAAVHRPGAAGTTRRAARLATGARGRRAHAGATDVAGTAPDATAGVPVAGRRSL
jgi:hypothetical protein